MTKNLLLFVGMPLAILGSVVIGRSVGLWGTPVSHRVGPHCRYPQEFDLGEREKGDRVTVQFAMRNDGDEPLIVDQVRSSCACTMLEQHEGKRTERVSELHIGPGEERELQLRVTLNGAAGLPRTMLVLFRTNDPEHPNGRLAVRVSRVRGGLFSTPSTIFVGDMSVGEIKEVPVTVLDDGIDAREFGSVDSSNQGLASVRIRKDAGPIVPPSPTRLFAAFDVTVAAKELGEINEVVAVRARGQEDAPVMIPVVGQVVGDVVATPQRLVLPRESREGSVFSANCLIRSPKGVPIALIDSLAPPGVELQTEQQEPAKVINAKISLDPVRGAALRGTTVEINARISLAGKECNLVIPLVCRRKDG